MNDNLERVAEAVHQVRQFLIEYGDTRTTPRLVVLADRLRDGDETAIASAISEATGGMGSLRDRYICPENGDRIIPEDVALANRRLEKLVKAIEDEARSAAAFYGINLVR